MKHIATFLILLMLVACAKKETKVLVFSKTKGFRHASIVEGKAALLKMGSENNFNVDTTEDSSVFNEDNLKQYDAIIFLSTTGDVFDAQQQNAFTRYIQAGGGFVGIHAATDTEYDWPWYNKLVGGYFASHPHNQVATLNVVDRTHESTKHLDAQWKRLDEWYNFKQLNPETKKLINIDESTYEGGTNGKDHPMSWYHEYDGGRAWYTALGHTKESFVEENFLQHILGGIKYAIGSKKKDYSKAKIPLRPDQDRFTVKKLIEGQLFEPTEMAILPNSDVLIAQRRGEIMKYDNKTGLLSQIGKIPVYDKAENSNGNAEEGLMGLKHDPDFANNQLIYLFYAHKDSAVNRLSQFKYLGDSIDFASEKVVLDVKSTRNICCHTGGSIAFSGDGQYLFLSTGDNATPFDEPNQKFVNNGFGPLDDRPGHEQYDARRSSGNTNDLRGKILRLKRNPDATFSVPDDNLFKKGNDKARPEIYVMGNRNPYRISIDPKNMNLYWGEVGPDARDDKEGRGPRGYDEVNQAKKPGNYGWPMFVGKNYAYHQYDYNTGASGDAYNAEKPINNSRNNTGLTELPPAQPAMIYYPYAESEEFPQLASGGRNAMAGPVYYNDLYPKGAALPDYFSGKLFIYDWIRQWIKVVHVDGDYMIEPFLEDHKFNNIIDMEVAPNGEIYLLEYGKGWFSKNPDAGLSKVVYNANNRVPKVISDIKIDKVAGLVPHTFNATLDAKDPDGDELTYIWSIGNKKVETKEPKLSYTLDKISDVVVSCTVKDNAKNESSSSKINVTAGNKFADISINIQGNQSMYFPNEVKKYSIEVGDDTKTITENIFISQTMNNNNNENLGHLSGSVGSVGESLMSASDCQSCHKKNEQSIGPSYVDVAKRYEKVDQAIAYLAEKIRIGGSGNWGEGAMAAHPSITQDESTQIVEWILSLTSKAPKQVSMPIKGSFMSKVNPDQAWRNSSYLQVSYTDKPENGSKPLTIKKAYRLLPNSFNAQELKTEGMDEAEIDKQKVKKLNKEATITFTDHDLNEIKNIKIDLEGNISKDTNITFTLIDSLSNTIIATAKSERNGALSLRVPSTITKGKRTYKIKSQSNHQPVHPAYIKQLTFSKS